MSKRVINTNEEKESFVQIWKYLSANGKLFIPVYDGLDTSSVYAEENEQTKRKVIRAFLDTQAIEIYISRMNQQMQGPMSGELKVGIAPVKLLQTKLSEVYGKESQDDFTVECTLTSYDELGNIHEIDTIWTQIGN